jgi:hypothetical protein
MLSAPLEKLSIRVIRSMIPAIDRSPQYTADKNTASVVDAIFVYIIQGRITNYILACITDLLDNGLRLRRDMLRLYRFAGTRLGLDMIALRS